MPQMGSGEKNPRVLVSVPGWTKRSVLEVPQMKHEKVGKAGFLMNFMRFSFSFARAEAGFKIVGDGPTWGIRRRPGTLEGLGGLGLRPGSRLLRI